VHISCLHLKNLHNTRAHFVSPSQEPPQYLCTFRVSISRTSTIPVHILCLHLKNLHNTCANFVSPSQEPPQYPCTSRVSISRTSKIPVHISCLHLKNLMKPKYLNNNFIFKSRRKNTQRHTLLIQLLHGILYNILIDKHNSTADFIPTSFTPK
jgi:hypothetical protein